MSVGAGLESLAKDTGAQEYWMRRILAYVLDSLLVWVALALIGLEAFSLRLLSAGPLSGPVLFAYTVALEYAAGQTVGKWVMGLRVVGIGSKTDLARLLMREVSKVFLLFMALDIAAGLLLAKNGRQRYLEVLSDTTQVVDKGPNR
jgi:uncharacterized RDD family membrane protein YckC